jgi:levanase/fructan beta-fructosidase
MMLGWLVPSSTPTYPWTGQMSIPRDLILKTTAEGVRLFQEPAEMIKAELNRLSHGRVTRRNDLAIGEDGIDLGSAAHLSDNSYWVRAELNIGGPGGSAPAGDVEFRIAGRAGATGTIVGYDAGQHQLYINKTQSGKDTVVHYVPVQLVNGILTLEILVDRSSLEVFAADGARVYTTMIFPDAGAHGLTLLAKGGDFRVKELTIWNIGR